MSTLNKVILIGNLGADPETRTFENGQVSNFSIATSQTWKNDRGEKQSSTEWHRVVVRNGLSEVVSKYVKKGHKVYVEGRLKTRNYQDGQGVTQYVTEVIADVLTMLTPKDNEPPF